MLLQIETGTACNLACWFCQNRHLPTAPPAYMQLPLYRLAVDQGAANGFRRVSHAAYNEPMADPLFLERLRLLKRLRLTYVGYSNGTLLDEFMVNQLVDGGLDWPTTFNLPTADPARYKDAVHRDRAVEPVVGNIRHFVRRSKQRHRVEVNGLGDAEHLENYQGVLRRFADLDVEVAQVRVVSRAGQLGGCSREAFGPQRLRLGLPGDKGEVVGCAAAKLANVYVGVYGEVCLCCHDQDKKYTYGNLEADPLAAILASDRRREVEARMMREFCPGCESAVFRRASRDRVRADLPDQLQPADVAEGDVRPAEPGAAG